MPQRPPAGRTPRRCAAPPKPRTGAYDRRPGAGPGRSGRAAPPRPTRPEPVPARPPGSPPPQRRPEASRLLAALADPNRGFEAVVVGEPQRAFYGNQFGNTYPLFAHYGVPLWVPEVGGPIDPDNEAHDLIMSVFGGVSKGERNRIRVRVRTAMATQAQIEGRYLGGRPPYCYRLIDVGPHPNPAKAAAGKQLHALAIDEPAAAVVRRIFAEFLAGHGLYAL